MRAELVDLRSKVALFLAGLEVSIWLFDIVPGVLAHLHPRVEIQTLVTVCELLHHRVVEGLGRKSGLIVTFTILLKLCCLYQLFLLHDRVLV